MASETQIGQLVIDLKIKTEALEKGLETAKNKLQEIEKQNEQVKNSNNQLDASFIAMSAGIVASLAKIKSAVDDGVQKYNNYINSMKALQKTAEATNNSFSDIKESMEDVNKLKLMDDADVTASTKNLLTYGFTVKQTSDILKVLQDAAVGNRQASYSLSEAVRVTTEGIRMENSVLSDAAGVQKNISKMYEEHAKAIGKTVDSLTQAEKAQAVYNGIMAEASMFTGSAAEMAQGYQGVQAQANASNLELSRTIGESMIPALTQYSSLQLSITQGLTEFIKNHKSATSGVITFTTTLLAMIVGLTAAKKAYTAYKTAAMAADMTTKAFTISLMTNPITLIAVGIAAAISGLTMLSTAISENEEATAKLEETTKRYNEIKNGTFAYTDENISQLEKDKEVIEEQIKLMEKQIELQQKIQENNNGNSDTSGLASVSAQNAAMARITQGNVEQINKMQESTKEATDVINKYRTELNKTNSDLEQNIKTNGKMGESIDDLKKRQEENTGALKEAKAIKQIKKAMDIDSTKTQQKEAAQLKINADQMQKYLDIVKKGNKSTVDYQNAVKELAKTYPEAANAEGIIIDQAQDYINSSKAKADQDWNSSQTTIKGNIEIVDTFIKMAQEAEGNATRQQQLADSIGIAYQNIIPTLTSVRNILAGLGNAAPATVAGITPTSITTPSGGSSSSYQNKALDNYKKQVEHKKALDKISLKQEIAMYQTALKRYAKTQDEKWELQEKIYELQKELQEKTLDDYTAMIEHKKAMDKLSLQEEIKMYQTALKKYAKTAEQKQEIRETLYELNKEVAQKEKELLSQQTEDYEAYIEKQKSMRGASYTVEEQTSDYDKIIKMHKSYLEQIMKDERLSLDERKEIYREELSTIRQYEQQKRDLRVQAIDNTVSQLTNAITKQLEEMQNKEKDLLDKNLKTIEEWKDARVNAINEEYDARIEAIEKELEALDKAEKQKTRDEEDADYEKKKKRLEDLIAFEHDATTKANYQKELDKLVAEHQKTLDKRELSDKKDALNEQKSLLKDEQDNKIKQIELETEKKKEAYDQQLKALEDYYNKQISKAEETAQQMLLNVEDNQNQIIALLQTYGDAYAITGQTFGEKLGQSFADTAMQKIQSAISQMQRTIDAAIASNIARLQASAKSVSGNLEGSTVINKTVNVEQNNTITSPVDSPSTAYKKQETLQRNLANSIATVF